MWVVWTIVDKRLVLRVRHHGSGPSLGRTGRPPGSRRVRPASPLEEREELLKTPSQSYTHTLQNPFTITHTPAAT